ncbi:ATP-binding protein [Bacillaceae bacterium S4-13-58]
MHLTLRTRILIYLLVVSLSGVLITSFTIFFGVENQFTNYIQKNRENNIELIREKIFQQYRDSDKLINEQLNNLMLDHAMTDNLYYKLYDSNGEIIIDTTSRSSMMGMMGGMHSPSNISTYESSSFPLEVDDRSIGSLTVFYPMELMGNDSIFLNSIKKNILVAVFFIIFLSIMLSILFSKRLTTGFKKLIFAISGLRDHQWRTRVPVDELTVEMKPLGESFNQLAESLAKEESLRKQFTANFAHELRTPLATLRSHIEAFQDGIWEPDSKRLGQCHAELMRLVRLVNELEKLIAAENPQIRLNKENTDINQLLSFVKDQFDALFYQKKVELKIRSAEQPLSFLADRDKVIQILTNIVNNALQYTPSGKSVYINVKETKEHVVFIIEDEGYGIKEEDIPYLYERFYRGDKSRDRKTGGVGIGLSIVKALVDAHKGEIKIDSKPNHGTTVEVKFPKE